MPEQITQKLGFDASTAITSLTNLNKKLGEFRQGLQATSGGLRKFETNATTAVATFNTLGTSARRAAASINALRVASGGAVPPQIAAQAAVASAAMGKLGTSATVAQTKLKGVSAGAAANTAAMNTLTTATNAAALATRRASATIAASADKVTKAMKKAGKAGAAAGKTIGISWKTIGRIILAQGVIRGLSLIVSTFNAAQEAAREFSLRVGEISTIADGALGSIDSISHSTLELSRALGLATSEVAEGLYQTLSNQVVDVADAMRFETTAARLSITTHSQLKESINALSSVMNSYGLDISEVDEVSAVLFQTIKLGRLRMGEFGDVLGRVTPLTAALGIEYKEMAAALAALTQKGVPAHTAITQLTAVTQKLLRPTEKLKELYHEWGVETGPEAIRRFGGLRGVLLKMRDATAGNDAEFADLLGRVRSMVGAMNLTTDGADSLTHALQEMEDPTEDLTTALARMESTIGRRSVRAWDDLDVSITQAGETFLRVTTPMVETLANMARNMDTVVAVMGAVAVGSLLVSGNLAIAGAAVIGLTLNVATLGAVMLTLFPIVVAVATVLAALAIKKAFLKSLDTASDLIARQAAEEEAWAKAVEGASKRRIAATKKEVKERTKLIGEFLTRESKAIERSVAAFAIKSRAIGSVLGDTISRLQGVRISSLKAVEAAVLDMDGAIENSKNVVAAIDKTLDDIAHNRKTRNLSELRKLYANFNRAEQQARKATAAFSDAQASTDGRDAARKLSAVAETSAQKNLADAISLGNQRQIQRAEQAYERVLKQHRANELKWVKQREKLHTKQNATDVTRAMRLSDELVSLSKIQRELASDFDKSGERKGPEQLKADKESLRKLGFQLQETIEKYLKAVKFADSLKLDGLGAKTILAVQDGISEASFDWVNAVESLREQLAAGSFSVTLGMEIANKDFIKQFEARKGEFDPLSPKNLDDTIQVSQDILREEAEAADLVATSYTSLANAKRHIDEIVLDPKVWSNYADSITDAREAGKRFIELQAEGFGKDDAKRISRSTSQSGILINQHKELAGILDRAIAQKRSLTEEELKAFQFVTEYNAKLQESEDLTGNRLKLSLQINKLYTDFIAHQKKIVAGEKVLKDLGDSPTQARANLEAVEKQAKTSNEEVAELEKGVGRTTTEVSMLSDQWGDGVTLLNGAVTETDNITGATERLILSQGRLNELRAKFGTVPPGESQQPTKLPEPPPASKASGALKESLEGATEATKPLIEGVKEIKTLSEGVPNFGIKILSGVTQATEGTGTLGEVVKTLGDRFIEVAGKVNTISTSVVTTTGHVDGTTTATGFLREGMSAVAIETQSTTRQMALLEQQALATARAIASISAARGSAGAAFHGGPAANYMAAGGPTTRGKDTIPVMAAPGEFFVNARNSRRFASELQAMNTGREPIFRDRGGSVTNVGDINVSVTQGGTASNTARQIATSLRRELRRGTSRL